MKAVAEYRFKTIVLISMLIFMAGNAGAVSTVFKEDSGANKLRLGLCFKKFYGFYWTNGFVAEAIPPGFSDNWLKCGFQITTSELGTGLFSAAIPLYAAEAYAHYRFRRQKQLQPFAGLNFGYAKAVFKDKTFSNVQDNQLLLSPEFGLTCNLKVPLSVTGSFGYNLLTGNGVSGLGLVYPLYFQFRVLYDL